MADWTRSGNKRSPGQRLHSAHRSANHASEPFDPQMVEQDRLRAHHVGNGDNREFHTIGSVGAGVETGRPGTAHTAAQYIDADDAVTRRINGFAFAHQPQPPAGLSGYRMCGGEILIAMSARGRRGWRSTYPRSVRHRFHRRIRRAQTAPRCQAAPAPAALSACRGQNARLRSCCATYQRSCSWQEIVGYGLGMFHAKDAYDFPRGK